MYAILFFLAILFVAIGFERGGTLAGLAVRQSATFPETWYLSCATPSVQAAGQDLANTLVNTFDCQRGQTAALCDKAINGLQLGKGVTAKISCPSLNDRQQFVQFCKQQVAALC